MRWPWFAFLLFLLSMKSYGYPDFIGYGYASCMTCHYNGQGNGPLNDYGRALWSAEISSRVFANEKTTDEQLGEQSGFLGSRPLPWWIRPGVKYRGLWFQTNPGSQTSTNRYITMQASINAAVHFDQNQKYIFVADYGFVPTPQGQEGSPDKPSNWISREHYLRWQVNEENFVSVGLMDKVYGIRIVDHTAFSRSMTGNAQNDQTHGVIWQKIKTPYEYTGHVFMGNLSQDASLRQKGLSVMVEKDITQYNRVGGTALFSSNDFVQWLRMEGHTKIGFGKGNALLAELGLIQNKPKSSSAETGAYIMAEAFGLLTRGYNLLSQLEYYSQTLSTQSPDQTRWSFGLWAFPAPRLELRLMFVNGRSLTDSNVTDDQISIQSQIHVSL